MFYRFARVSLAVFALLIVASSATNRIAMAQATPDKTFNVASQVWPTGQTVLGPFNRPAGKFKEVAIQIAAPTDWQTGAAGRVMVMSIQKSADGVTWRDSVSNGPDGIVSPQMGKNGAFPTILVVDIADDPASITYRVAMTLSAPVTCGWTVTLSGQPN